MNTDKHGFNRRKRREQREEGKIMRGKIMKEENGKNGNDELFSGLC
jgi:hypothetical protein